GGRPLEPAAEPAVHGRDVPPVELTEGGGFRHRCVEELSGRPAGHVSHTRQWRNTAELYPSKPQSGLRRRPPLERTPTGGGDMKRLVPAALAAALAVALLAVGAGSAAPPGNRFTITPLASDVPGLAPATDPNLQNTWGLTRSATSPWWIANNATAS